MRNAAFDTARSMSNCAGASCRKPKPRSRNGLSTWPVKWRSGVPAVAASTSAPAALPAPVPVLVTTTPSPPEMRADASAMLVAPASPRAGTKRMRPRRWIASRIGMLCTLTTPKARRTPASSRKAAMTSPSVEGGSLMARRGSSAPRRRTGPAPRCSRNGRDRAAARSARPEWRRRRRGTASPA